MSGRVLMCCVALSGCVLMCCVSVCDCVWVYVAVYGCVFMCFVPTQVLWIILFTAAKVMKSHNLNTCNIILLSSL